MIVCFLLGAALAILGSASAYAMGGGNGNPNSNGTFFPNEGTFQTTIRGVNLSGVATFSTSGSNSTTSNSTTGTFAVAYKGTTYAGNMDASIDTAGGTIAATMEASVAGAGTGVLSTSANSTQTLASSFEQTGNQVITFNNPDSFVINPITGNVTTVQGGQSVTNAPTYGWVDTIQYLKDSTTSNYLDNSYVSGSFTAQLKNSYPNQIFKGKGTMTFEQIDFALSPPAMVSATVSISVKGARTSNTAQSYTAQTVAKPYVTTTSNNSIQTVVTNRSTN